MGGLQRHRASDSSATMESTVMSTAEPPRAAHLSDLISLVYDELRWIARRHAARVRPGLTLQPTEIVNEACIHLILHQRAECNDVRHFRAIAARKIWQIIVDQVRRRRAQKRGGVGRSAPNGQACASGPRDERPRHRRVPLESLEIEWRDRTVALIDLADALEALGRESARLREVVMLHWFAGLAHNEVAAELGVSRSTAEKEFRYALAWLARRLGGEPA